MDFLILLSVCLFMADISYATLEHPLTLEERLHIFGQVSSEKLPNYEYTSLQRINVSGLKPFRKRPPTFLQYRLKFEDQIVTLSLKPNTEVLAPECVVYRYNQSGPRTLHPCQKYSEQCLFTGKSEHHNDSWVAANVCNGLEGVVSLANTTVYVSPLDKKKLALNDSDKDNVHVIYRYRSDKHVCATNVPEGGQSPSANHRRRRSPTKRYIEMSVFVDPSMVKFHGDRLEQYVQTVVNVAAERYQDKSLGEDITLTLKQLHIIESYDAFDIGITYDAKATLNNFCKWQAKFLEHQAIDVSVLITRINIEHPIGYSQTTGLANPKGVCDINRRCAVVEDTGPNMGLTMAHEIGHLIGMRHDAFNSTCKVGVMSETGSTGPAAFIWSTCSVQDMRAFINTPSAGCLKNIPRGVAYMKRRVKPGTLYTVEEQCRLFLGKDAVACYDSSQDVCARLSCRKSADESCDAYGFPLMDGSDCNNTRNWCIEGRCTPMDILAPGPIDGEWSAWDGEFTTCSRTCGGGVKIKRRRCNSPPPQYGGRQCAGKSLQAEICNIQTCQFDFKAEQCSKKNTQNSTYNWIPLKYMQDDESCVVRCWTSNSSTVYVKTWPETYKDGTECFSTVEEPFSRCLAGKCMNFGCDGRLESGYQFDQCGVCNGTGDTCRQISGSYGQNNASRFFTDVAVIPKGSTSIMIHQYNPYCFLSLAVNGQRIFNKNIQGGSNTFFHNSDHIDYNQRPERIHINGPLHDDVEIQVYRSFDYRTYIGVTPNITYTYFSPKITTLPSKYAWFKTNTQCSKECGTGVSIPIVKCGEFDQPVEDHYCDIMKKPSEAPEPCNTHLCPPEWRTSSWSSCSVSCGHGDKSRSVFCAQKDKDEYKLVQDEMCRGTQKPEALSNCTMGQCAEWRAGPWSSCSKTCSEGKRERFVACYREGEDIIIKEEFCQRDKKPQNIEFCNAGKCRPDLTGSHCVDRVPNCKPIYGFDICVGIYAKWAEENCMRSCGICSPFCEDDVVCSQYLRSGLNICEKFASWSKLHCPKVCGFCGCKDTSPEPCFHYNHQYCTDPNYSGWMSLNCRQYCNLCNNTTSVP